MQRQIWALPSQLRGAAAVGQPASTYQHQHGVHTTQIIRVYLSWFLFLFLFLFSEGGEGNIHIAFIFNTSADASGHVLPQNLLMSDNRVRREPG